MSYKFQPISQFQSFCTTAWNFVHYETNALNDPISKLPHTCSTNTLKSKIPICFFSISSKASLFSSYRSFSDKCTQWSSNDRKRYDVKGITYICILQVSLCPSFAPFVLVSSVFGLQDILCVVPNNPIHILQLPPVAINFISFFSTDSLFRLVNFRQVHRMTLNEWYSIYILLLSPCLLQSVLL